MVMTKSGGANTIKLRKGSSSCKGKTFDQEGLIMEPIDVEPLSSAPLAALVPYATSKVKVPATDASRKKENSPIKSLNTLCSMPDDSAIRTLLETMVLETETKVVEIDQPQPIQWVRWVR